MTERPKTTFSHIALCTSDLERSVRFYTEALGFEVGRYLEVGPPFDLLTELPGLKSRMCFLQRDGVTLELLSYDTPPVVGTAERRPMNQLGLTHISFIVDDLDAAVDRIANCGGRVHSETKTVTPMGALIFCTDPDGVRVELFQSAD
jgi:lactoylglutathione lyase